MRKIKIFSDAQSGLIDKTVTANTWGGLKQELEADGIFASGMTGMVKETQSIFATDTAILPTNIGRDLNGALAFDFTLFLTVTKTKSGLTLEQEIKKTELEFREFVQSKLIK